MPEKCVNCMGTQFYNDEVNMDVVCSSCGVVVEEFKLVNEPQFEERSNGIRVAVGERVNTSGAVKTIIIKNKRINLTEGRENTMRLFRLRLEDLARSTLVSEREVDSAYRWYMIALQYDFTTGRKTEYVAASLLYVACRLAKTPHMLIDFSQVLRVNLYKLGTVYLKLLALLKLDMPVIDPSIYITRFCSHFDFENRVQQVSALANKLVAKMSRCWLVTGRKPSGVCGAAILASARINGFNIAYEDIVYIVKLCSSTIRRRIKELTELDAADDTVEAFLACTEEGLPPSYKRGLKEREMMEEAKKGEFVEELDRKYITENTKDAFPEPADAVPTPSTCSDEEDVDADIQEFLLSKEESEAKEKLWNIENYDYVEKVPKVKKSGVVRRQRRKTVQKKPESVVEAAQAVAIKNKFSSKIDLNSLKYVFGGD